MSGLAAASDLVKVRSASLSGSIRSGCTVWMACGMRVATVAMPKLLCELWRPQSTSRRIRGEGVETVGPGDRDGGQIRGATRPYRARACRVGYGQLDGTLSCSLCCAMCGVTGWRACPTRSRPGELEGAARAHEQSPPTASQPLGAGRRHVGADPKEGNGAPDRCARCSLRRVDRR